VPDQMRYIAYHRLEGEPNVIVDGSPTEGTVLTVTHWPGYPPPEPVAADLSAQMAFRLLERPELLPPAVEAVSNNHFDQDGLVSIFTLVDPAAAIARRSVLEDVAAAGDFAVCRDRDAARVSMLLSAYAAGAVDSFGPLPVEYPEQTAVLYGELLGRLPELVDHVDRFRSLWAEEDDALAASEAAISNGAVTIEEIPDVDLAVVDVPAGAPSGGGHRFGGDWVTGLHPMAVNTATSRLVVATRRGRRYDVELRYESWVQLRSRPLRLRRELAPLAARLQEEELADVTWSASPVGGLTPRLTSGEAESSIAPDRFVELLAEHLRTARAAWDPYAART
jgi:hypothetical protein